MATATGQGQGGAFRSGADERAYIQQQAQALGLDPEAVLAVAAHEGVALPALVGDQGTSFGPWQLHAGGALPANVWQQGPQYAQQWANSQAGIDYALAGIARVAKGLHGPEAVRAIVYGFEHPADPAGETRRAVATYQGAGGPSTGGGQTSGGSSGQQNASVIDPRNFIPGAGGLGSLIFPPITNPLEPLKTAERAFRFFTSWRFVEVVGGFLLLLLGLALLGRQFGIAAPVPTPIGGLATRTQPSPAAAADFEFPAGTGGAEAAYAARPRRHSVANQGATYRQDQVRVPRNDVSRPLRRRAA